MVRVYHEELCFAIVIYCFSIIRCCFIVMFCCLICLLFGVYPRSKENEAGALIGTGLNIGIRNRWFSIPLCKPEAVLRLWFEYRYKKSLVFNTTLQTRGYFEALV